MQSDGSITRWLHQLQSGDGAAAQQLWNRFCRRLQQLIRRETAPWLTGGSYDAEDVASSAFAQFCHALQAGNYPDLTGRQDLWRLLATITMRKARERARMAQSEKRGGEPDPYEPGSEEPLDLDTLPARALPPDTMMMLNEECERLLNLLPDDELKSLALWKLEGYTNDEIAEMMGYTRRTVQRMLTVVRRSWEASA